MYFPNSKEPKMNGKLIACCGINCATCDACIATMTNDEELRAKTAEKWSVEYNSSDITAETLCCTGCRQAGAKFAYCEFCEIRNCVKSKGFETCEECDQLENCSIVGNVLKILPEALDNLKSLN